jgi:alpha-beta hydrolase superfamily lysophospholipase
MSHEEGVLQRTSTQGPKLHSFVVPVAQPRVVVGILHGYADYSARYAQVMDAWAERGITSVAIDLRGHGRAEGRRGHCERFGDYLDDAAELAAAVRAHAPGVPAVLFGHSFGGLIASRVAIAQAAATGGNGNGNGNGAGGGLWKALALSSPFFGVAMQVPQIKIVAGRVMSRIFPSFAQGSGLHGSQMTHDEELARAYDADPLSFKTVTARWFTETSAAQDAAIAAAPKLRMPLYVVVGGADPVVSVPRARAFYDAAGSTDKTWDAREGLFHEVLNEPSAGRQIAERLAEWILAHAK